MRLKKIDIYHLKIPLSTPFKHALADHRVTENLIVRLVTKDNIAGFGEGVPRKFVTGERLSDSVTFLKRDLWPLLKSSAFEKFSDVKHVIASILSPEWIKCAPAACCGLELAILDAAGKNWKQPVSGQFGPGRQTLRYSGVLPMVERPAFEKLIQLVKDIGIKEVKLKVGDEEDLDRLLNTRRMLGPDVDIRVDANGAWEPEEAVSRINTMAEAGIQSVEQPVAKNDLEGLHHVIKHVRIPVVLDESICGVADAENLALFGDRVMFNLRLSKCGGMVATSNLYGFAKARGIQCQLGCQVGETSILAAAGQQFAANFYIKYLEGAYAAFLLTEDVVKTPVSFGNLGLAKPSEKPGLGVNVDEGSLERLSVNHWALE